MLRFIFVMVLFFSLITPPSWAENTKPSVAEQVNEVNVFNRTTDYLATFGETDTEKASTLEERKEERRVKRLQSLHSKKEQEQQRKEEKIMRDMKRLKGSRY